jgi:hypothetical protein
MNAATLLDLRQFWELITGAIALRPSVFEQIQQLPAGTLTALLIAVISGFSQAIGQGIVLFINRVKPIRFILSLLLAAILEAFSYIFWAFSTWLIIIVLLGISPSLTTLLTVTRTLGLAYAPLLFSFLVALPYLGVPISVILSIWSFLAFLVGLIITLGLTLWQAFWGAALGWAVFQISQRTIGRPLASLGQWLENTVAGVKLVSDLKEIEQILETTLHKRQN